MEFIQSINAQWIKAPINLFLKKIIQINDQSMPTEYVSKAIFSAEAYIKPGKCTDEQSQRLNKSVSIV
jgi:hypothetical protein